MYGIFTYIWLIFMVNVGEYTSPMDGMGLPPRLQKKNMCQGLKVEKLKELIRWSKMENMWVFPKIGVPPNHPF